MRARAAILAAMLCAVLVGGLNVAPAQATIQTQDCWDFTISPQTVHVCLVVNFRRDADGKGVWIDLVRIYASGDVVWFESKAVGCDNLRLWNDNQTVLWRKDNSQCDLYKSSLSKTWYPGNHLTQSDGHIGYTFNVNLDQTVDPDPGHDHVDATN